MKRKRTAAERRKLRADLWGFAVLGLCVGLCFALVEIVRAGL